MTLRLMNDAVVLGGVDVFGAHEPGDRVSISAEGTTHWFVIDRYDASNDTYAAHLVDA